MATRDDRADLPQRGGPLEVGPGLRVLQAIVDTLLDGAPPELAVELREELPDPLRGATRPYNAEAPVNVDEFLERFRRRAHLPSEGLLHEAQIAIGVVEGMLPSEAFGDLRASLPAEFSVLFDRRGVGLAAR